MTWQKGQKVQRGQYEIDSVLGHGRFAVTYLAQRLGEPAGVSQVVLKTLNDEAKVGPERDRLEGIFAQEAQQLARCEHPNVVRVFSLFWEEGHCCIPMEYVAGIDLSQRDRPVLPPEEALDYVRQIGAALVHLHSKAVLHRDVRPGNVRLRAGRREVVLVDFGSALGFADPVSMTRSHELNEGYAAPELYFREGDRGAHTDLYALGALLYNLLTGREPPRAIERQDNEKAGFDWTGVDGQLQRAIAWAMELDIAKRPKSVTEWLESLPGARDQPPERPKIQLNWATIWTAVGSVAAVAGLAWTIYQANDQAKQVAPPQSATPSPPASPRKSP